MQDLANSDCIVIQGSNMAEAHPVAFQYVVEAKRRGATVIHVDPRFSRTSALAHRHVGIRAGSDIVFLGAIINYILSNDLHFEEYVRAYTNGPVILRDDFQDAPPWYFRTISSWIALFARHGLRVVEMREPLHPRTGKPVSLILIGQLEA